MSNTGENAETLEWVYGYESTAETVLGTYTIDLASNVFFEGEHIGSETDTSLKAKEIAQADFDRRVRSAPTVSLILRLENERDVMREKAISNARERNDAEARIAELEAQGWELSGSITDLGQRLETAETLLEEARRALAPFIRLADNVFSDGKNATVADEVTLWCFNDTDITFGDLRRARAALDRIGK